jgi:hypothetical protein
MAARDLRRALAECAYQTVQPEHLSNGEEADYPFVANYSKGLPHDEAGDVNATAYQTLLRAVCTGSPEDFERGASRAVRRAAGGSPIRRLVSPSMWRGRTPRR